MLFIGMWLYSFISAYTHGFWFIYLTHWSLTVETVYFCFATYTARQAQILIKESAATTSQSDIFVSTGHEKLPWFVNATWILMHVEMPASLMVFLMYWTLDNPIYNLQYIPKFLGFFVHGINFFICLFDLFLGRNVFYLKHVGWFLAYSFLYVLWSLVHHWAKIGTYGSCVVDDPTNMDSDDGTKYPADECPIYAVLNWHKPTATGILSGIMLLCVVPLCQFPIWWCVRGRRSADYLAQNGGSQRVAVQQSHCSQGSTVQG